ncbi:hypothetical protein ACIG0D_01695 [Streptomyces sp. NPDC052773]|uniref:hypothetical protein n=1 Tax=Streptomyces sp. NPDC052773 TaxID=3365693 RepID=UPI0037CEC517
MEIARLILDYIKALTWPAVTLGGLFIFRQQLRDLSGRISRANFMGVEIEAAIRETQTAIEEAVTESEEELPLETSDPALLWLEPNPPRFGESDLDQALQKVDRLEHMVRRFAYEVDTSVAGETTLQAARTLVGAGLVHQSSLRVLRELLFVRDQGGRGLSAYETRQLADSAAQLQLVLQVAQHAYRNPRTRVVGDP